jgi:DNA replication protein DnaC
VTKSLEEFDRTASTIPGATLDYLSTLEWASGRENLCLVGPAGTGKSHLRV